MVRKYFGTDGIRGRANGVITPELALKVGQATGLVFRRGEHRHRVVIGKDTRLSGYMIETALVAGFTSVGMDVLLLGPMPTPAVAMLTRSMRADLGVMISASHNPFDDNGIKLFGPDGYKLSDEVEHKIEAPDRRRHDQAARQERASSAAPSASTACTTAISNSPSARCRAISRSTACASSSTAPTAPPIGWRRTRCGSSAPTSSRSASNRTASTSIANAARPRPTRSAARCARCAPISASRSTATPTASSSPTSTATWSTATSFSR